MRSEINVIKWKSAGPFIIRTLIFQSICAWKTWATKKTSKLAVSKISWDLVTSARIGTCSGGLPGSGHQMERGGKISPGNKRDLSLQEQAALCLACGWDPYHFQSTAGCSAKKLPEDQFCLLLFFPHKSAEVWLPHFPFPFPFPSFPLLGASFCFLSLFTLSFLPLSLTPFIAPSYFRVQLSVIF